MSKIDTQGMSGPSDPNFKGKKKPSSTKPMVVQPRRLMTPEYAREMKILINEVLDEREYKKRMKGSYDLGEYQLPISYFDTEHFKHSVLEDEPPYQDWTNE